MPRTHIDRSAACEGSAASVAAPAPRRPAVLRVLVVLGVAWVSIDCAGTRPAPTDPATHPAPTGAGAAAIDPVTIDAVWAAHLESPADETPGYRAPYRRLNKRPSTTVFEKFPRNPVLGLSKPPAYDSGHVEYPSVVAVTDSLWMFYAVYGRKARWSIAAATSRDGIDWQRVGEVLVPDTTAGAWDGSTIAFPNVLYEPDRPADERFRMYYAGKSGDRYDGIGLAVSGDGRRWTRRGTVLRLGGVADFDSAQIVDPSVVRTGEGYRLYYCGSSSVLGMFKVGVALSGDGEVWVKQPGGAVYELDPSLALGMYTVDVMRAGDTYVLFESSPDEEGFFDIFATRSVDGWSFDSATRRRVLAASHDGSWDHVMVYGMATLRVHDWIYMWFNGIHRKGVTRGGQIGFSRAPIGELDRKLATGVSGGDRRSALVAVPPPD